MFAPRWIAPRRLTSLALTLTLAACGGSDAPLTAPPVLPDPETPAVPVLPVASVSITAPRRHKVGESYQLSAVARTASGAEVTRPVTWRLRETRLATISSDGVLTPRAVGSYEVEAEVEGRTYTQRFSSYDWFLGTPTDALLWSDEGSSTDGTDELQLLGLSCTPNGEMVASLSLYGLAAGNGTVRTTIDSDAPVTNTWSIDPDGRVLFLVGANAETMAFADRLTTARRLAVTVNIGGGATRTFSWRVSGLGEVLTGVAAGCRAH